MPTTDAALERWAGLWSQRPRLVHLALFFAAYLLAAGFAKALALTPGTGISIWPPSGLFVATLIVARKATWPFWVATALLAELASNVLWFHNPVLVAVLLNAGNALCAMSGAWLVTRFSEQPGRLETLQDVLALVLLGAVVAPMASATVGAATLALAEGQPFTKAWPL
jgi:integral membrane sensor domain MASE1